MAFLDWLLRRPDPAAKTRVAPKQLTRRYKAAKSDRIAPFGINSGVGYRELNRQDLRGLVAHSRKMANDNPFMRHFLKTMQRNVIGPKGLRFQSLAANLDGSPDLLDRLNLEKAFNRWAKRGNCTVCGQLSLSQLEKRLMKWVVRDGVCFVRRYAGRDFGGFNYQLQILPMEALDHDMVMRINDQIYVHGGIEYNEFDRPIAYHMFRPDRLQYGRSYTTRDRVRIPADQIFVITVGDDDVAGVGVPWAHAALRDMNLEEGFEESAMTAARAGAAKMGFLTQSADAAAELASGPNQMPNYNSDGDGVGIDPEEPDIDEVSPGMIETLPVGWDFTGFDPGYPDAAVDPFIKVVLRRQAVAVGLSYATYTGDLTGSNFVSMRRGVQEERDEYAMLQEWFQDVFSKPMFMDWLRFYLISDFNFSNARQPFSKFEKFSEHEWQVRGYDSVNPLEDAQANNMNFLAGLDSPQRAAARRGMDFNKIIEELAQAQELAKSLGVPLQFQTSTMAKLKDDDDEKPEKSTKPE